MNKTDKQVLQLLKESGPLALSEITEKLGIKSKAVFRSLRRLFEKGEITSDKKTHRYALALK